MEPGDLRINSRLREDSGVPKNSPGTTYGDGNSVLHFRNHAVRPAVITDGRLHHLPLPHHPLLLDRNEPVKVWRDPSLINSGEIRHVVSMQHSGVVHLSHPHPMVAHSNVNSGGNMYHHQHHDNRPLDATSREPSINTTDVLRGRAPVMYVPHPAHHPSASAKPQMDAWRPSVVPTQKDFRVNLTGKSTVEQAVHDHFVESLRLAHLKGNTTQPVAKHEERPPNQHMQAPLQRFYPPPHDKRHHDMPSPQVIYQLHQHQQALTKAELPAPPPLRSEPQYRMVGPPPESSRKHQIYGAPDVIGRSHDTGQQQSSSIRYEPEPASRLDVLPSENCVRYQKLPPAPSPRRHTTQSDLQLERNRSPFSKQPTPVISPNSFHMYPQAHISKHKVISPAPSHMYGKPGPSTRPYDMVSDPSIPLPLTSKGGTRPTQSSPTLYAHTSPTLPQHDMRKSDVAYYMYNNGPPGFHQSMSPQAHIHAMQTQPLDLGGKRKLEEEMYKGPIPDYSDQTAIKSVYGSRKPPFPIEESRPKMSHNHVNNAIPLSLTVAEIPSKRKIEDATMPLHFDTKKVRNDTTVISSTNIIGRSREQEIRATMAEPLPPVKPNRPHIVDNISPISLIVSGSDAIRRKPEITHNPIPLDIKKPVASIGAALDTHPSVITTAASVLKPPVCNGKHNDSILESKPVIINEKKAETEPESMKIKVEPSSSIPTAATSSSSSTMSAPTKFQKVPKKAWVLQWHEGDGTEDKTTEESNNSTRGTKANDTGSTSGTVVTSSQNKSPSEKNSQEDCSEKLVNGANVDIEGKSQSTTTTVQSLNGFGKEKLNDSDIGSENESDNSGKEKSLTDSGTSPVKKNGRKGKDTISGQSSPKPDLRKDGLCKRPHVIQLKKTGESFIQAETCNRVTPKIGKCRECRWHPSGRGSKRQSGAYCRFYGFRKLRYTKGGCLTVAGFSDPYTDPSKITEHDQFRLWLPSTNSPEGMDTDMSKFLLSQLCNQFCDLVQQEEEARNLATSQELSVIAWKPLLKGVREMCDVCDTTLFNFHWACGKCGFVVCLACFKSRKNQNEEEKILENTGKDRDEFQWLLCSNRCGHELDKLMLVQTIAGDALIDLNDRLHRVCSKWDITVECDCKTDNQTKLLHETQSIGSSVKTKKPDSEDSVEQQDDKSAPPDEVPGDKAKSEEENSITENINPSETDNKNAAAENGSGNCEGSISDKKTGENSQYFGKSKAEKVTRRKQAPLLTTSVVAKESAQIYPSVKHSWLCNGKLLRLLEAENPENYTIFHEMWKCGLPVLVSNIAEKLDRSLWTPESFSKDFGDYKNDLVNCISGNIVSNQQMRKFWEGFSNVSKRIKDEKGDPIILKLKDWPPTDDFAQTLPTRYQDLLVALPMPEYTLKDGRRNLAARLPADFMKPDLGPKMYIAYGSGSLLDKGTTKLHLDISDAVNMLVYCEAPQDINLDEHNKAVMNAIEESDCDVVTIDRVLQKKEVPGAIWHLYEAKDADKIRNFLNKVAAENGVQVDKDHDVFHDQSWYLDTKLRKRLQTECNVDGYAILQCAGDAIFIPAGAPHQVRNLQSCIKVAEDFVSPENISHSFYLSEEEFYNLSKTHSNREDRLQIKNIVYHTVKDAVTVLLLHNTEKSENSSKHTI